jgi:hypothetical protein
MNTAWYKSLSRSNGNCLEVAELLGDRVGVRNSRDHQGPVLQFTSGEWQAFLGGIRCGEFVSFVSTAPSVRAVRAHDLAVFRDDPQDPYRNRTSSAILRATEPDATRLLSARHIGQTDRGDATCTDRALLRHNAHSRLQPRGVLIAFMDPRPLSAGASSSADEADKSSHPWKNRQMSNPRHVESGNA